MEQILLFLIPRPVSVLTCNSGESSSTLLTGFTLTNGLYGIVCDNSSSPAITNMIINNCSSHGINAVSGSPQIHNSLIENNSGSGIYSSSANALDIKNNWIYENNKGLEFDSATSASVVRNNTIVYNTNNGIVVTGGTAPAVSNCILWENDDDLNGCTATYSCIQDQDSDTGNIFDAPAFVNVDSDNYHLSDNSPCINAGDQNGDYTSESDIDGEGRTVSAVDMGADECYFGVWYVNANLQSSSEHGTSWSQAFTSLQSALAVAEAGEIIWVAAGTYYPDSGTDRTASFELVEGVTILGGFGGDETNINERDWQANPTILSGDIGTINNISDNSYHVVIGGDDAILDGFIIISGNANGSGTNNRGGGIYNFNVSPTIKNCSILGNNAEYGGGMYNDACMPQIVNCIFSGNTSSADGGAMYNNQANPKHKQLYL